MEDEGMARAFPAEKQEAMGAPEEATPFTPHAWPRPLPMAFTPQTPARPWFASGIRDMRSDVDFSSPFFLWLEIAHNHASLLHLHHHPRCCLVEPLHWSAT
ncbi:hypothetical protein BHE74_00054349 [Ensete ventricosum]|nr:hypothetical protein BHE74_00054349 [Ensete ventricosum]